MSKHFCYLNLFLLFVPIEKLYASTDGGGREIFPREASDLPTVYHPFNLAVKFRRVEVDIDTKHPNRGFFTNPYKPAGGDPERAPQRVLHLDSVLQSLPGDTGMISATADRRRMITATEAWPHRAHGCLIIRFAQQIYGGSGVLIGPRHLLTCAHNVYWPERERWAERIEFYPALKNGDAPYDGFKVVGAYILKAWLAREDADAQDLALLVFQEPIGLTLGFHGVASFTEDLLRIGNVHVTGYPGDKGGQQMWTMSGPLDAISDDGFTYDIDTAAGQSGGAINLLDFDGNPYVVGVHTRGGSTRNSGLRLSLAKWNWIIGRMADSGDVYEEDPLLGATALSEQDPWLNQFSGDERSCLQMVLASREGCELQKGAKAGNPKVQTRFARVLLSHWNGDPSANKMAVYWLRLAAGSGEFEAKRILRSMALPWTDIPITRIPTFNEMLSLLSSLRNEAHEQQFELAAREGRASAQVVLAKQLLENWVAVPQDNKLAVYFLHLAAGQQEAEALTMLERFGLNLASTEYDNFSTLEEVYALFQMLKKYPNGTDLYKVAMEGNLYIQTYIAKQLLKSQQGIPRDNRLAIYLLQLAARRYYGDCARELLKNMGLSNPRGWFGFNATLQEVQCMMQVIEEDGGMELYQAATGNEMPLRLHKRAQGRDREAYDIENVGDPVAQKTLAQRLLSHWTRDSHNRICQSQSGPSSLTSINRAVDEFMDDSCREETFELESWNMDQTLHALHHLNDKWFTETKKYRDFARCLLGRIEDIQLAVLQEENPSVSDITNFGDKRTILLPGDNWFAFHWLQRAAMLDEEASSILENLECDLRPSDPTINTADIDRCLTLAEMRCLLAVTQLDAGKQLYHAAVVREDPSAQNLFGSKLLEHWSGIPQDNRLAICWLQYAARKHNIEAQQKLLKMNLFWNAINVEKEESQAAGEFHLDVSTCERRSA